MIKKYFPKSGIPKEETCGSSLEKLCQKLTDDLAEETKQYWIDPQRITFNKFLGHGKQQSL